MNKLIIILGPTASGKTSLAVDIAYRFNGEIISADSRQIYKGMDIGTGKDLHEYKNKKIKYHLIDILDPSEDYSVFKFKRDFNIAYKKIIQNNKTPILCGGTALYIDSILYDYKIPKSKPNIKLRTKLGELSFQELKDKLIQINKEQFNDEYHISKRRLIRSIEILNNRPSFDMNLQGENKYKNCLVFGIKIERKKLLDRIQKRLKFRIVDGMIDEVQNLIQLGFSHDRLNSLGLEYRFISKYLSKDLSYDDMVDKLNIAINQFSKRQMTFFRRIEKRGTVIHWIPNTKTDYIDDLINKYLKIE